MDKKVINKSKIGAALALPGYISLINLMSYLSLPYIKAPPTGTIKFLSKLETIKLTVPYANPKLIELAILLH